MKKSFQELLEALRDENQPFPLERIAELSDLDKPHLEQLEQAWPLIPVHRKQILIQTLGQQAFDHFELTFEGINRIAMHDPNAEVRSFAIQNLWECEDPALAEPFLNALKDDPVPSVRSAAAAALGLFVWLGELEELPAELLIKIEDGLLAAIQRDEVQEVRRRSLESLGFSSREEVAMHIEDAYQTGDDDLMQSALFAMGRSASGEWKAHVLEQLTNASPKIRLEAARAAGELEIRESIDNLIDLLEDVNDAVRDAAIWALSEIGGEDATNALIDMLGLSEDEALSSYLSEALDHMAFVDGTRDLLLFDFDDEEPSEDLLH